jgi:hypothetical protein
MPPWMVRGLQQRAPILGNLAGGSATRVRSDACLRICPPASPSRRRSLRYTPCEDARATRGSASEARPVSPVRLGYVCKTTKPCLGAHRLLPLCRCPTCSSSPAFPPLRRASGQPCCPGRPLGRPLNIIAERCKEDNRLWGVSPEALCRYQASLASGPTSGDGGGWNSNIAHDILCRFQSWSIIPTRDQPCGVAASRAQPGR